ncbi:MAG: leucyl aminopeptidase, partial [Bacteroidia bacterium]|nr:leucyl aminopeptidase [Bacteroidia bacterium]
EMLCFAEGMALGNYQFLKYKGNAKKSQNALKKIFIVDKNISSKDVEYLNISVEATCMARTWVNEPLSYLTATKFADEFKKASKKSGFKITVFNKAKIKALKMGGLLAVNLGSIDPPTFSIMEWKPKNAVNKKPIVLVGKGVVYDTGGLSLKPTANSMDFMKCDMGGGATVGGAMYAVAKAKLPVHLVGLVPATDNRPDGNAYAPGDVITMYSGKTVEVLNTDAEGRMIMADALHYAKKYKPELVMDFATLTGAAAAAIGPVGVVCMGTADEKVKDKLKESGGAVHERLAELPFWDEYGEMIKSDLADIKNLGGPYGGAITAGKFLEHFTDYPYMHFDIAGMAYLKGKDSYRGKNGTGVGVRLLFDYFRKLAKK